MSEGLPATHCKTATSIIAVEIKLPRIITTHTTPQILSKMERVTLIQYYNEESA